MSEHHITPQRLKQWAQALGFQQIGISGIQLGKTEKRLQEWLSNRFHGDMTWMEQHGTKRTRPDELVTGTVSVISVRMNYQPPQTHDPVMILNHPERAYISRYALGRDYHKVLRNRLQKLASQIKQQADTETINTRVFVDSAPVMEKPIAVKAGLGWMGKHTNVINKRAGSWFFLGEIYTNLALEPTTPELLSNDHCGDCTACLSICPTRAIIKPYVLDARRCISYLTIEHKGIIAEEFHSAIGNRIYGCDDCQLVCPWNRFAETTREADFAIRNGLDSARLLDLFNWNEAQFLDNLQGSPIRRIGFERWQRNLVIALGNAPRSAVIVSALKKRSASASELVRVHIDWALRRQNTPF